MTIDSAEGALNFNPRSREGSDSCFRLYQPNSPLFQSTLPRRERREMLVDAGIEDKISIHAPAKGATN